MKQAAYRGKKNQRGQSLVEILVAVAVITLTLGGAVIVVTGNQSLTLDRRLALRAAALASEGLEAVKSMAARSWDAISSGDHGLLFLGNQWQFSGVEDREGNFRRVIKVTMPEENVKDVESDVFWQINPLRPLKIRYSLRLTNWRGLFGNWKSPRSLGSVDLGPGNSATDVKVRNKIVYLTAEASSAAKPDFFIVDATDGSQPFIISSLLTGPGLNALDLWDNYAFVANRSGSSQLQVINIANVAAPILTASYKLPGNDAVGLSIFVLGQYAYLGTALDGGREFHIIDVNNPRSPQAVGNFEIGAAVNAIYVLDGRAYIATAEDDEIWVLDVSEPLNPRLLGKYDAPGDSEDGKAVQVIGSKLYLGRLLGGNHSNHHELHVLDVANPSSIVSLGSLNFNFSINDLFVRDYLVFLATDESNSEFQIYNISDPGNIVFWSSFNFPQMATGIDYENNTIYVSVRSNDALRIITSSP